MAHYLGVSLIEAEPCEEGYKTNFVKLDDGTVSYTLVPKEAFERKYLKLTSNSKLLDTDIENFLNQSVENIFTIGDKTTVVRFILPTGWEDIKSSSCVNPTNYNRDLGSKICREHMKTELWKYLGFVLQWAVHGLNKDRKYVTSNR